MEMETQDKIEDRAEDNQMMDDGGVREEVCCYSAVDTDVFCWEVILIAYCRDQLTTNP